MEIKRIRASNRLSAARVKALVAPGLYEDGAGLRFVIDPDSRRSWALRLTIGGKRTTRRLGAYPGTSLEEARREAEVLRKGAKIGVDTRAEAKRAVGIGVTFREMFEITYQQRQARITNSKAGAQWKSTLAKYAFPSIGDRPVAAIETREVIDLLMPIWFSKPETGKRVLQRMAAVFETAIIRGVRERASPTIGIAAHLGTGHRKVEHQASMPWREVPKFVKFLRTPSPRRHPVTALAFELLILTAGRSGEVRGATWTEIVDGGATWTIPGIRMKGRVEHRVPLPVRCRELLGEARKFSADSHLIFPSPRTGTALSDMVFTKLLRDQGMAVTAHGFRSSFKEWCATVAKVPDEVSEAALAHADTNRVRAAYLRTDLFDERRPLMEAWAEFCGPIQLV